MRLAIELPLSKEEILRLQRQEKQIKIIIEELKAIQLNHEVIVRKCKRRLYWKGVIEKVLTAITSKNTRTITGNDMAGLIKAINTDDIFTNQTALNSFISESNKLVDELLPKIRVLID